MGWWSRVIPKEEVDLDELQKALKEHEAVFEATQKQTRKTYQKSQAILGTAESALDILGRVEKKK